MGGRSSRFGWKALTAVATAISTVVAIVAVGVVARQLDASILQIRANTEIAQQAYLQNRGQDFLSHEYDARETLHCLYDWWFDNGEGRTALDTARCDDLRGVGEDGPQQRPQLYARTMLYVEEALMYLVEESRMACETGVDYARELDIWRNDVSEDVSGAFSYYLLYRFAAPEMGRYFSATPLADTNPTPTEQLAHFVAMAKLHGLSAASICDKADRFRNALGFPIEPPNHVISVCASTDGTRSEPLFSGESESYCADIHGGAPPLPDTPSTWTLLEWLTALAHAATILGVPIFLVTYLGNLIAERRRAEHGAYDALDEKYVEFQKLAVQHPHLDIADAPLPATDIELSPADLAIRRTLYQILLATFERAYLMYRGKRGSIRKRQWAGWDAYVRAYCARPAFVDAFFMGTDPSWDYTATFDRDFEAYLKKQFAAHNYLPPR